jgi:parvulin-like peptidyl-prolyl isomerase
LIRKMARKPKAPLPREVTKRRLARWQQERRRRRITVTIGAVVILAIVAVIVYGYYATSIAPGSVRLATVSGTHLTSGDYLTTLRLSPTTQTSPRDAFTAMVNYELIRQGAAEFGLQVSHNEVMQEMRESFTNEDEEELTDAEFQRRYAETLDYLKVTAEQFEGAIGTQLLAHKIDEHLNATVPEVGTLLTHVHLRNVDVHTEPQAEQVMQRLEDGEAFASITEEFDGGDLGWLPRGMMSLEVEQWAFSQATGNATRYFQRDEGYTVVQVMEPAEQRPLADEPTRQGLRDNALAHWFEVQWDETVTWQADDARLEAIYIWAMDQIQA